MLTTRQRKRILASMRTLGELLRTWQAASGYSDSDAARHCDLSPQHWYRLIRDERSVLRDATLSKLALGTGFGLEVIIDAANRTRTKRIESRIQDPEGSDDTHPLEQGMTPAETKGAWETPTNGQKRRQPSAVIS